MKIKLLLLAAILAGLLSNPSPAKAGQDVGVSDILSPPEKVVLSHQYYLKSVIFNLGTQASDFDVFFGIKLTGSSGYLVADTVSIADMPMGSIDTVTFSPTFTPAAETTYEAESYTILSSDENHANDATTLDMETLYGLAVWYGNIDTTSISAAINSRIDVDVYIQTNEDVYIGDVHLCLGANLTYIDSMLSVAEGQYYYPFTQWDVKYFNAPDIGQPAMPDGYASQSFQGFGNIVDPYNAPWLHSTTPLQVLTYVVKTVNDSTLIGSTVEAFVKGYNRVQGQSNAGDSTGDFSHTVVESHSLLYFTGAGRVTGAVTDENSLPLEGVEVVDLNTSKSTSTDSDGEYTISGLYPGPHDISFSHPNQRDTIVTGVTITRNGTRTLNVQMQPLPFHDVGVTAILSPPEFVQQNIEYALKSEVTNMGTSVSTFDVIIAAYPLGGATPLVADTTTIIDLSGGAKDTVTFDHTLTTTLDTTYQLVSYTVMAEDIDASNDTVTSTSSIFFGVSAWYGNLDSAPIAANIGDRFGVDVYIQTLEDIYLSFIHLSLGTANRYVDSLLSRDEGQLYYPFTEWDIAQFTSPQGTPPNPDGWSSQSFVGFSSIGSTANPWLHSVAPTKSLTFMVKIVDDLTLIGDTIQCFGIGYNSTFGQSNASDTLAINSYPVIEVFSPVYFKAVGFVAGTVVDVLDEPIEGVYVMAVDTDIEDSTDYNGEYALDSLTIGTYDIFFHHPLYRDTTVTGVEVRLRETTIVDMVLSYPCNFLPGDVNSDGRVIGSDVTYLVNYFRMGPPPPDSCFNANSGTWLYSAADVNGDCNVIGSDVTYLVQYFHMGPALTYCPYTPPPSGIKNNLNVIRILNQKTISLDTEDKQ